MWRVIHGCLPTYCAYPTEGSHAHNSAPYVALLRQLTTPFQNVNGQKRYGSLPFYVTSYRVPVEKVFTSLLLPTKSTLARRTVYYLQLCAQPFGGTKIVSFMVERVCPGEDI